MVRGQNALNAKISNLESQFADWDSLTRSREDCQFFQLSAWPRVLAESYGHRPILLTIGAGASRDLLPLMEVASPITGRRGVSLPFADFCQPLAQDQQSVAQLQRMALAEGKRRRWRYVEFRGPCLVEGAQPSLSFHEHVLGLQGGAEAMLARCEPSVRRAIRKGAQSGLKISVGRSPADIEVFYKLHSMTRKRHGLPPQPFRFFESIARHVFEIRAGFAVIARLDGRPVAANVFFRNGREAIYKYGASDFAYQQLRPSNLVMWEGMKACAAEGAESLHLGRTSISNEGLRRFKLGFGAQETTLRYYRYDFRQSNFVTVHDRADTWMNRVFGLMPSSLLRICGRILYPHLS